MSSLPPPPPPPPPPPSQSPGPAPWSTPISSLTDPAPPVSEKRSGFPAWGWIVVIVAVLGGAAVALIAMGGEDEKKSNTTTIEVGGDTTIDTPGGDPATTDGSGAPITTPGGDGQVPTGITGTLESPVPVGQVADIGGDWRLQVLDVIPDAGEVMEAGDEFYDAPPAGTTYLLVKVALGYFGTEDPKVGFEPDLAVLGSANVSLDDFCLATVPDEVDFFNYVFSGGVVVGNACFIAPIDQAGTFQLFGKGDFFADEGVYLELASPAAPVEPMSFLAGPQPGAASTADRLAPAAVGVTTAVGADWQVTVTGPARDITADVMAENTFNSPPPEGFRFVGIDMTFTYNGAASASPATVSIGSVGNDNVQHDGYCGVVPGELDLYTDLFAGGSASGTRCIVVPDDGSAITLFATADFNGFIWFATS